MQNVTQVFVHGVDDVRLAEVGCPVPGDNDAVLEVAACGICGSDLAYIEMGGLLGPQGEPMPLGHELSGRIAALGSNVRHLAVGERVVVNPVAANNLGNGGSEGGFTQQLLVKNASEVGVLLSLPASLSDEQGALVEPLSVATHAVNQADVRVSDKLVVFGAGPIGLGVVAILRFRGVDNITVVDVSEKRLALARQLGASTTIAAATADVWTQIKAAHGRDTVHGMPVAGSDVFIDAAGVASVFRGIVENCKFGARIVVVAMHKDEVAIPVFHIMAKELTIRGSMAYPKEFGDVIAMLDAGLDASPMVTHRFPLAQFSEALAMARRADEAGKVIVTMDAN
ncbi:MAG: (R,R)-butanediol dehydrogenase/meso-butanediol dehydrogenase/diacetyl reductase [Bermanella sp.]|jgi:(R,R)-butanediol dehydrogenase/meso-butanediol dehydrogenase/diacetyl reductase